MNPRVTLIDNYMTEFEADQSLPLDSPEFLSAINALHGSSSLGQSATASCTSSLISTGDLCSIKISFLYESITTHYLAEYYLSSRDDLNHTGRGSLSGSHRSSTSDINSSTSSIQSAVSFASVSLTNSLRGMIKTYHCCAASSLMNVNCRLCPCFIKCIFLLYQSNQ